MSADEPIIRSPAYRLAFQDVEFLKRGLVEFDERFLW